MAHANGPRARDEERDVRVPEAEWCEPAQLLGERERQVLRRGHGVDDRDRVEVALLEGRVGVGRERLRERWNRSRVDREPRRGAMPPETEQVLRAGGERTVQVEARDRPAGAPPPVLRAGDEDGAHQGGGR